MKHTARRAVIASLVSVVLAALLYWFWLPPIHPRCPDFWTFILACLVIVLVVFSLAGLTGEQEHLPAALSGGMARRLALVRALALGRRYLLLDEPFTGVDAPRAEALMAAVRAAGTPVLLAAHERHTLSLADTVVYLDGPPLKVLQIRGKPLQ